MCDACPPGLSCPVTAADQGRHPRPLTVVALPSRRKDDVPGTCSLTVSENRRSRLPLTPWIDRVLSAIAGGRDRGHLTLATGTGKRFIAFQVAWKFFQSRWNLTGCTWAPDRTKSWGKCVSPRHYFRSACGIPTQLPDSVRCARPCVVREVSLLACSTR